MQHTSVLHSSLVWKVLQDFKDLHLQNKKQTDFYPAAIAEVNRHSLFSSLPPVSL